MTRQRKFKAAECDCTHDGARWLSLCDKHRSETDALHAQAQHDYQQSKEFKSCQELWTNTSTPCR
jgi:hypothetical protein